MSTLDKTPPLTSTDQPKRRPMISPMAKPSRPSDRRAREAAELQLFVQRYARKARRRFDPNDRSYDRKTEVKAKRMKPEALDARLRHGDDDDP
jgi:hypothetical protein